MAAEADMLRAFACWLSPRTVLASYNGRCYDAPLLKTRYRLARLPDPLGELRHVDLLFPSRRRRSEEHTSELQSLMRISYAVFCLKKKKEKTNTHTSNTTTQI